MHKEPALNKDDAFLSNNSFHYLLDVQEILSLSPFLQSGLMSFFQGRQKISSQLLERHEDTLMEYLRNNRKLLMSFQDIMLDDPFLSSKDKEKIMQLLWVDHNRLYYLINPDTK